MTPAVGDIIGNRYTLTAHYRTEPGLSAWLAHDQTLQRECQIFIISDSAKLAQVNAHLADNVETIFLPPSEKSGYVSSTVVREVFLHNGDLTTLVPENVLNYFMQVKEENAKAFI